MGAAGKFLLVVHCLGGGCQFSQIKFENSTSRTPMLTLIHFSYKNMTLHTKRLFWQAWCFQNEKKSILGIAWGETQQTVFIRTTRTIGTKPSGTLDVLSEKIA